ncbi:MAG TPA: hypothetical protein VH637_06605 [Streptosporangiaceae bacterium]
MQIKQGAHHRVMRLALVLAASAVLLAATAPAAGASVGLPGVNVPSWQ